MHKYKGKLISYAIKLLCAFFLSFFSFFVQFLYSLPLNLPRKLNIHFRTQQNFSFEHIVTSDCALEMYIKAFYIAKRMGMIMISKYRLHREVR